MQSTAMDLTNIIVYKYATLASGRADVTSPSDVERS